MKLTPVTGPGAIAPSGTPEHVRTAKAVEAFNKGASSYDKQTASAQSQTSGAPPVNQNNIGVEELGAIQRPAEEEQTPEGTLEAQGEEQTSEVPEPAKPVEDPALSRQFAQLARQERALRAKEQQQRESWKAKEAELAAREAALQPARPDLSQYVSIEDLKRNSYGVLQKHGISYDEVSQQALAYQPINPQVQAHIDSLEAKLAKLETFNETSQKTYQDQQQAQYQAAVKQIELDVTALVKADPVTYEAIAKTGKSSIREVTKLIEETYNKDGILLPTEEAAQLVEDYLVEEGYKTYSQIEKFKKRFQQTSATPAKTDAKTQATPKQPQPMKTLTNATASTRQLTVRERAIAAMEGRLK